MALVITGPVDSLFFSFAWARAENPYRHLPYWRNHPALVAANLRGANAISRDGRLILFPGGPMQGTFGVYICDDTPEARAALGLYGLGGHTDYFGGCGKAP